MCNNGPPSCAARIGPPRLASNQRGGTNETEVHQPVDGAEATDGAEAAEALGRQSATNCSIL